MMLTAVNVAVPAVAQDLTLSAAAASWLPLAYLLAASVVLLPAGRAADLFGRRRVFLLGLVLSLLGTLGAAAAANFAMLIGMRLIQGVGAGLIFANSAALITSVVPPQRRGRAIGAIASAVYVGLCFGPLLAGWSVEYVGWRLAMLVQIPFQAAALIMMYRIHHDWQAPTSRAFDWAGSFTIALSLGCLTVGSSWLPDTQGITLAVIGLLAGFAFVRIQLASSAPLLDIRLLAANRMFSFSCAASLATYSATFSITFLLAVYLQNIRELPGGIAGLLIATQPVVMALLSPIAGRASDSSEPRLLATIGMFIVVAGLGALAFLDGTSSITGLIIALVVIGAGFAMFSSPNINAIMGSVERPQYGVASATSASMRIIGQLVAMAVTSMVFALTLGDTVLSAASGAAIIHAIQWSFVAAALTGVAGLWFSAARGRLHGQT